MATASPRSRRSSRCRRPMRSTRRPLKEQVARLKRAAKRTPLVLSSASGEGVQEVLRALPRRDRRQRVPAERTGRRGCRTEWRAVTPEPRPQFRRIVLKVGSALLVDRATGRLNHAWLAALAEDIAELHARGADVLVVSSGAIALGRTVLGLPPGSLKLEESQAAAAVGQIALARDLVGGAGAPRPHRRPDPADPRRHRGAPALPQRPRDDREASRDARRAGHQRERHGGDERDPLRRQRPPRRARRHHDRRRSPGAVLRRRRPLHRAAGLRPGCARTSRSSSGSRRRSRPWPAAPPPSCRAAACTPRSRRARSRPPAAPPWSSPTGAPKNPLRRDRRGRALHLVPDAVQPGHGAQDLDRRRARAARHAPRRRRRGEGLALRHEPAAGRRRAHRGRASRAAMRW